MGRGHRYIPHSPERAGGTGERGVHRYRSGLGGLPGHQHQRSARTDTGTPIRTGMHRGQVLPNVGRAPATDCSDQHLDNDRDSDPAGVAGPRGRAGVGCYCLPRRMP
jgi:hypothetical protein